MINQALSGIRTAQSLLDISAHNTANAMTKNFKPQSAIVADNPNGGSYIQEVRNLATAPEGSDLAVDLTSEMVQSIQAEVMYKFNAETIKTYDQTTATLINIKA